MNNIFEIISNLKFIYLVLIIFIMIVINIILIKKEIASNYKYLVNGICLIIIGLISTYLADIIKGIFSFTYLSVKLYIVLLILTNIVTLLSIQKRFKFIYKMLNYLLFIVMNIILGTIIVILIGTKLNILKDTYNFYPLILLNISTIVFITYLTILCLIYILSNITIFKRKEKVSILPKKKTKENILSNEELLSLTSKENFTISGVECSIIFEDSIPDNIIKNYHILLKDINAKMVNGYTLEENRLLKSICLKLNTNNLSSIDLNNLSILNKISVDEYNLLKKLTSDIE